MPEIDNCPICNTTCELEFGLEEAVGIADPVEVQYATCKTCKARWRRRDDPRHAGRLIYEKWACRIPELNISFPFVGGSTRIGPKWCRWTKVRERQVPVEHLVSIDEEPVIEKGRVYDERFLLEKDDYGSYEFKLSRGDRIKGEIHSDEPVDIWFLDEINFGKFERDKTFHEEDVSGSVYDARLDFKLPSKGKWFVVIENLNKASAEVKVKLFSEIHTKL